MRINVRQLGERFDWLVLVSSLVILQTPALLFSEISPGAVRLVRIVCLLPFWAVILRHLVLIPLLETKGRLRLRRPHGPLLALLVSFLAMIVMAYVRAFLSGTISASELLRNFLEWVTLGVFGITLFLSTAGQHGERRYYELAWGLVNAVGVYITLNVLMYVGGVRLPNKYATFYLGELGPARILSLLGIDYQRALFPFAVGINAFGGIAGAALVAGAVLLLRSLGRGWRGRVIGLIYAGAGSVAVLLTDSRVVLVAAIIAVVFITLAPRRLLNWTPMLVVAAPLVPGILLLYRQFIAGLANADVVQQFARGTGEIASLNSRTFIWEALFAEYRDFLPAHLFGYGIQGQVPLGLYRAYSGYFTAYLNPEQISLHNYSLQYLVDMGYLGLLLFSLLLMTTLTVWVRRIGGEEDLLARAIIAMICFLVLVGTASVDLTPYSHETFAMLILCICAVLPRVPVTRTRPSIVPAAVASMAD